MSKTRYAIFAAMIFSVFVFAISDIWTTSEFTLGGSIPIWALSFIVWTMSNLFADTLIIYHYFERLLIITNRTHLRKFILVPVALALPTKVLILANSIVSAIGGPTLFLAFMAQTFELLTAFTILDGLVRVSIIFSDAYIIYRLKHMGFNETGYSGTRISRLVISLVVNIAYTAWSGAVFVPDEGAARMGLKVLLEGLDLLIIMDFFSIDLNGALKTTSTNTKPTKSPTSGQTDKVLSTQLVGLTA